MNRSTAEHPGAAVTPSSPAAAVSGTRRTSNAQASPLAQGDATSPTQTQTRRPQAANAGGPNFFMRLFCCQSD